MLSFQLVNFVEERECAATSERSALGVDENVLVARHADGAVTAIAEVVGHGVVGGCSDVRGHVCAGAPVVPAHVHRGVSGVRVAINVIAAGTGVAGITAGRAAAGAVIRCDIRAVTAEMTADLARLGRNRAGQHRGDKEKCFQSFHSLFRDLRFSVFSNGIRSEADRSGTAMQRFGGTVAGGGQKPGVEPGAAGVGHRPRAAHV